MGDVEIWGGECIPQKKLYLSTEFPWKNEMFYA